jgi:hypothetical protein
MNTKVTRNKKYEVVITVSGFTNADALQRFLDHIKYLAATSGSTATQADVDALALIAGASWWKKNRKRMMA